MSVLVVAALIALPFVYVLVCRPILRRLALRNAVRRPRESQSSSGASNSCRSLRNSFM